VAKSRIAKKEYYEIDITIKKPGCKIRGTNIKNVEKTSYVGVFCVWDIVHGS
jgi:hypothetical protein